MKAPVRRVRTVEGADYYGLPVGAIIRPNAPTPGADRQPAQVTEEAFLEAWHERLTSLARGLDLDDPDDRAVFRVSVRKEMDNLKVDAMPTLIRDLGGEVPAGQAQRDRYIRAIADAYVAAVQDDEEEVGPRGSETHDLVGATVRLTVPGQKRRMTLEVESVDTRDAGEGSAFIFGYVPSRKWPGDHVGGRRVALVRLDEVEILRQSPAQMGDSGADSYEAPGGAPDGAQEAFEDAVRAARGEGDGPPEPEDMTVVDDPGVLTLRSDRLADLDAMLEKANRRAERSGIEGRFVYEILSREQKTIPPKVDETGYAVGLPEVVEMVTLKVNVPAVKHEGYTFVATLTWDEEAGLITRTAPGQTIGEHRPAARECNVCNSARDRKDTFVVRKDDTGETTQVGRNCLQQFMGITPGNLWALTYLDDVDKEFGGGDEDRERGGGGGEKRYAAVEAMALAVAIVKRYGWVSRANSSERKPATVDQMWRIVGPPATGRDSESENAERREIRDSVEQYLDEAQAVIDFARTIEGDSDYAVNLRALAGSETVSDRNLPLFISAVAGKVKRDEQEAARQTETASTHLGREGDKIGPKVGPKAQLGPISARVTAVRLYEGDYGMTTFITMVDGEGHVLKWKASGNLEGEYNLGDPVLITGGSIKGHGEFRGVKETMLTRVKMTVTSDAAEQKRQQEQARIDEALANAEPAGPGLTEIGRRPDGTTDHFAINDIARRLKVGSVARVFDNHIQVKRGRSWDQIKTYRTGTVTEIATEPGFSGGPPRPNILKMRAANGEEFTANVNSLSAVDEGTIAPLGEPLGERVPAGMEPYVVGQTPLGEGVTVQWIDSVGEIGEDGVYRFPYRTGLMTTAPRDERDVNLYAEDADGRSLSLQRGRIVAVSGTPIPDPYPTMPLPALWAIARAVITEDYRQRELDRLAERDEEAQRSELARMLAGNDRVARSRARQAAREAAREAVGASDDDEDRVAPGGAPGGGGRPTRITRILSGGRSVEAPIVPVRVNGRIDRYEVTLDGVDYIISQGAQQGDRTGWGVRQAGPFGAWDGGIYSSFREAAASLS